MDPVAILLAAAAVMGNAALEETAKRSIGLAWEAAVGAIKRRFGADHPAPALVESLPAAAADEGRSAAIAKQLAPLPLNQDHAVQQAIERLAGVLVQQQQAGHITLNVEKLQGAGVVFGNQINHFD
jgi:hypothetical protein